MIAGSTYSEDLKINIKQIIIQVDAVETPDIEMNYNSLMSSPDPVDSEDGQIAPEDDILDENDSKLAE